MLGSLQDPVGDLDGATTILVKEVRASQLTADGDARGVRGQVRELLGCGLEQVDGR